MPEQHTAFVIMPFDDDFQPVYQDVIKPPLESIGFGVSRADDIESQQNILRDIVEGINASDLVIADLSGNNPNVFYELGLAHALKKPVLLLTQSIDQVPFDLQSYRIFEYNTDFREINGAREYIKKSASGYLDNTLQFGSPVTDFLQNHVPAVVTTDINVSKTSRIPSNTPVDDRGYIDHLIDINKSYSDLTSIMEGVAGDLVGMTDHLRVKSSEITALASSGGAASPVAAQAILRQLGKRIGEFTSGLRQANSEYATAAQITEDSLEFVASFHHQRPSVADADIETQVQSLRQTRSSAIGGRDSLLDLANTMDQLPRMERRLNRAVTDGSAEIRVMANNIDKTIASISRAIQIHDQNLPPHRNV